MAQGGRISKTLACAFHAFATAIVSFQKPYRRVLSKALASEYLRQTIEIFGKDEPETVHWIANYVAAPSGILAQTWSLYALRCFQA